MKSWIDRRALLGAAAAAALLLAAPACQSAQKKDLSMKRNASHVALARKLIEQNRLNEALTQTNMAIEEWGEGAEAYLLRGQVHFMLGLYSPAIEDFDGAMARQAEFTEALSWRAWARAESGDSAGAEQDWMKALADPKYPSPEKIHFNLALLYVRTGRKDDAISHLERAVANSPGYSRGHYELGKLRQEAGDFGGASRSFQAALGGMKDSPDLNLRLALVLERQGEGARAREHFKRVIELSPDGPEAELARDHLRRLDTAS